MTASLGMVFKKMKNEKKPTAAAVGFFYDVTFISFDVADEACDSMTAALALVMTSAAAWEADFRVCDAMCAYRIVTLGLL